MTALSSSTSSPKAATKNPPAPIVALAGLLLPGLGYLLVGERARGFIAGGTILILYVLGLLIGGVRVIDVPGYNAAGKPTHADTRNGRVWTLKHNFSREVLNKPWYMAQTLVGPVNLVGTWGSLKAADAGYRQSTARIFDIGTLYTAVAGMLNLLVIIDATYRSTRPRTIVVTTSTPSATSTTAATPSQAPATGAVR